MYVTKWPSEYNLVDQIRSNVYGKCWLCWLKPSVSHGRWNWCKLVNWHCSLYVLVFMSTNMSLTPKFPLCTQQNQMLFAGICKILPMGNIPRELIPSCSEYFGIIHLVSPGYSMILQSFLYFKTSLITNLSWDRLFKTFIFILSFNSHNNVTVWLPTEGRLPVREGESSAETAWSLALGGHPWGL